MPILTHSADAARYVPNITKEGGAIIVVDGWAVVFAEIPPEVEAAARKFMPARS